MSDTTKERILAAVPIESYIGRFVKLKKSGKGYIGLCPFHGEKSPSFHVRPDTGRYHCFGCGKDGDVFSFVMEQNGLGFAEALDELARYAGIERTPRQSDDPLKKYYDLNEAVLKLYREHLKTDDRMQKYMEERGIRASTAESFHLGSSPDLWQWLEEGLARLGFSGRESYLKEMGLVRAKEQGGTYDFFRGRLIFPIRDASGRLCGFGGRALPGQDDRAKYINSQDSRVFHKQDLLYGLYHSIPEIRSSREAILVEGYLDVIGLAQCGLPRAVGPLGTAFTEGQLRLIERYADTLVCMMDGDKAGRAAAFKAVRLALEKSKLKVRVVLLPEGLDAFDLSGRADSATILSVLAHAVPGERFLTVEGMFPGMTQQALQDQSAEGLIRYAESMRREYERKRPELDASLKREGLDRLSELTRELPPVLGQILSQEGSMLIGLSPGREKPARPVVQEKPQLRKVERLEPIARSERELVALLIHHPSLFMDFSEELSGFPFQDDAAEIMFRYLESRALTGNLWAEGDVFSDHLPDQIISIFHALVEERRVELDSKAAMQDLLLDHSIRLLQKREGEVDLQLATADPVSEPALLARKNDIVLELHRLRSRKLRTSDSQSGPAGQTEV
jgi:DNA primase